MQKTLFISATLLFLLAPVCRSQEHSAQGQGQTSDQTQAPDQAKSQTQSQVQPLPSPAVTSAKGSDQTPPVQQESLAEAARKARERKKETSKSVKVFTNDDVASPGGSSASAVKPSSETAPEATAAAATGTAAGNNEKMWRAKFAALNHKLDQDQEDLDVMQRELGVLSIQYYDDPVKGMQQGLSRSDINDQTAKIDKKKQEIEDDKQAISDAEDDLRKAGGDPGWAR